MRIGVIVEQFDNTNHCHIRTHPPKPVSCANLDELRRKLEIEYGYMVSYHYRDIGPEKAAKIGWVFQNQMTGFVQETWVSIVDSKSLKYHTL